MERKKCPYISPGLECMAGGYGHIACMTQDYHEKCEHKIRARYKKRKFVAG